jgi:hypothetical protein
VAVGISRTDRPQNLYFGAFDPRTETALVLNLDEIFSIVSLK